MSSDLDLNETRPLDWEAIRLRLPEIAQNLKSDTVLLEQLGLQLKKSRLIDFGPAALSKLEVRALKDFDVRRQLEQTARANFDAQAQTHELVLSLLESRNPTDLAIRLNAGLVDQFGLVGATICIDETGPIPYGWMTLADGGTDYIIGEGQDSLLGPEGACRAVFGDKIDRVKSAALVRICLWREQRPGLIALGSSDFEGFSDDMGNELIVFVARVIERVAARWPVLI